MSSQQAVLEGFRAALAHVGTTGAVRRAALGTKVPKMEPAYDADTFDNLGYIGPDGISISFDEDATEFIPLQELAPIRREITKSVTAIKFILWQSSRRNFAFFLGGVVEVDDDDNWYIDVAGKPQFDRQMFIADVVDGDASARIILPNGQLTERGDVVFKSDEIIGLECTITAFPADPAEYEDEPGIHGKQSRWYFSKEWDERGAIGSEQGAGPLAITTSALPDALLDEAYDQSLVYSGGAGSVSWSLASGSLPAGISLDADGDLTGTPTEVGGYEFSARVEDATGAAAERRLSLEVVENP